jgi:hypothetical protein
MQAVLADQTPNCVFRFTTLALSNFDPATFTGCTFFVAKALALTFPSTIRNALFLQSV